MTNRFKVLDLVDRMPEELWTEFCNIVTQEAVTKTILKRKNCNKAKWLSEEDLQIVEKSQEKQKAKEKGRYTQPNAEFQRITRRDKKALTEQCKETEENNRMGKTRDLFKKIRDTKGTFHAKMGTIKDRNGKDLIEAEEVKKGDKNTMKKNYTKKGLNDPG